MNSRIVLADDHKIFRAAIRNLLQRDPELKVIGEAGDGVEAVELVRSLHPDVVVMDIRMPRLGGVDAIQELVSAAPSVKVIVLSFDSGQAFAAQMLTAGARGYVTKDDAGELPRAIRAVMSDGQYLSPEVAAAPV